MNSVDDATPIRPWITIIRFGLIGAILALSAWIQFTVVTRTTVTVPLRSDAGQYFFGAYNLQQFGVYSHAMTAPPEQHPQAPAPDKTRPPGYSLFLAATGHLDRSHPYLFRIQLIQAGLGVASVLLAYLLAIRFLAWPWALTGALLLAISPHLAVISTYILTESLYYFLLLAALLASAHAASTRRVGWGLVAGLAWGACALVRPTAMFLPPLVFFLALLPAYRRRWLPVAAGAMAGFLLLLAPWQIRNLHVSSVAGEPNLTTSFLLHGAYPNFRYHGLPESYGTPYRFDPDVAVASRDVPSALRYIGAEFRQSPGAMIRWYLLGKPGFFLSWKNVDGVGDMFIYEVSQSPYLEDPRFDRFRLISFYLHWPLMLLGVLSAFGVFWRPQWMGMDESTTLAARIVAGTLAYAIAFHMVGAPFPRYGVPFRPLAVLLAMTALARLSSMARADPAPDKN